MRKYYLITDTHRHNPNPGDVLIGEGIEYLINEYEKNNCSIGRVSIFNSDRIVNAHVLRDADCIILCGTPQFGEQGASNIFGNFLPMLRQAHKQGIKLVNLYAGMTNYGVFDRPHTDVEKEIVFNYEDVIKSIYSLFDFVVSRCVTATNVLGGCGIVAEQLLCSTFYAHLLYGMNAADNRREYNVIAAHSNANEIVHDSFWKEVAELFGEKKTIFVCHSIQDYSILRHTVDDLVCVNNPKSLLNIYGNAEKVISLRVHGSTIAASLGAAVHHLILDSRSGIIEYAGIKSTNFTDFYDNPNLCFLDDDYTVIMDADKNKLFGKLDAMWGDGCEA